MKGRIKKAGAFLAAIILVFTFLPLGAIADASEPDRVAEIVSEMSLDEKISQMIIPAIRTWNGTNVTDLHAAEGLSEALQRHQYGGIILYGQNVVSSEQTARLVSDLQKNNAAVSASAKIPYLMPVDVEGGIVNRFSMGTRMTGNMAIAATGSNAEKNVRTSGRILGKETAALGFNVDLAPAIDVNSNPANPVIGTRSFSDDPETVGQLGQAYTEGLAENNVIATYKHFPGHGDTGTDSHLGIATVNKSKEELNATDLVPFREVIRNGADMIMTAHITLPQIDEEQTLADGTKGYYPATMSHRIMTGILREELGFDGVIITDALEMGAITSQLVPGTPGSAESGANIAEKVINAGVDILLLPIDLTGNGKTGSGEYDQTKDRVQWYDDYIDYLRLKVTGGRISAQRINESVTRILKMKEKYGILDLDTSGSDLDRKIAEAEQIVGSAAHHEAEMDIAREAVTLVQNTNDALPLNGKERKNYVFVGRTPTETKTMHYAVNRLIRLGLLPEDAYVKDLSDGTVAGSEASPVTITIDFYNDTTNKEYYNSKTELQEAVAGADAVIAISYCGGTSVLSDNNTQLQGMLAMCKDVQKDGGKFIALSDNLPYDSARYTEADAIVLAYMGSGLGTDPTEREGGNADAYNANVLAAFETIFGGQNPSGKLPVNVPNVSINEEGKVIFGDVLYPRGHGLSYSLQWQIDRMNKQIKEQKQQTEDLKKQVEVLTEELAKKSVVDITNYFALLEKKSYEYTGKAIEPKVMVAGLSAEDYTVSYQNNTKIGTAKVTITGNEERNFKGTIIRYFKITKKPNAVKAKVKKTVLKAKKLKKRAKMYKVTSLVKVNSAKGKVSYQIKAADKKSKKAMKIKGENVAVRKNTKKGIYKLKITVKDAGTDIYNAAQKTVTVKIRIK